MDVDAIYIKATVRKQEATLYLVSIESLITIFVYEVCNHENVQLNVQLVKENPEDCASYVEADLSNVKHTTIGEDDALLPEHVQNCVWPVITHGRTVVAGLCSVARQIIKSSRNAEYLKLLGFREASLMACSETSIWTKFCEIDMVRTIKEVILNLNGEIPGNIARFEYHMGQPCRIHNIYKVARQANNDRTIKSNVPVQELNLNHKYGEGPFLTLADVILYPTFKIFFGMHELNRALLEPKLRLTFEWFKHLSGLWDKSELLNHVSFPKCPHFKEVTIANFSAQSLYTADPKRYRPEKRIYTKQTDIENALTIVNNNLKSELVNEGDPYGVEIEFNWDDVPLVANPLGGALPEKRANRKCEQLENLAKAVIKLAQSKNYRIVDFCSGSGHLGILLAYLLPNCRIILVENKERSLIRAEERIAALKLANLIILQCNLDYFIGGFDIGVALHACGVATDLVLQNCIKNEAHFVCCPCCYGGIRNCHQVNYPQSNKFVGAGLNYGDYLSVAHAADQTHDVDNVKTKQGFLCMDVIDVDRKLQAESCGYEVFLGKLLPTSCTNKNNLLVGVKLNDHTRSHSEL